MLNKAVDSLLQGDAAWQPYSGQSIHLKDFVHIFKIRLAMHTGNIKQDILSQKERDKASRYMHDIDKQRYLLSKYLLRLIIGKALAITPDKIDYSFKANNKPCTPGIEFNSSHSHDYIIIAVSDKTLGIDIEYLGSDFKYEEVTEQFFSPEEQLFVKNAQNALHHFYLLWTRKEALLKATGEGLVDGLQQVQVLNHLQIRQQQAFRLTSYPLEKDYIWSTALINSTQKIQYWDVIDTTSF